jgi:3-phosphoshikimate 1-carboxyvinyltransferase
MPRDRPFRQIDRIARDGVLEVLTAMGAALTYEKTAEASGEPVADIRVTSASLRAGRIDGTMIPRLVDEIPILVLAATQATGTTVISGAGELRVKESDRIKTITAELSKMGANITEKEDGFIINGPCRLHGAEVQSYGDHRIAMTLAIAGLIADGETLIRDVECVNTSFPSFKEIIDKAALHA